MQSSHPSSWSRISWLKPANSLTSMNNSTRSSPRWESSEETRTRNKKKTKRLSIPTRRIENTILLPPPSNPFPLSTEKSGLISSRVRCSSTPDSPPASERRLDPTERRPGELSEFTSSKKSNSSLSADL